MATVKIPVMSILNIAPLALVLMLAHVMSPTILGFDVSSCDYISWASKGDFGVYVYRT